MSKVFLGQGQDKFGISSGRLQALIDSPIISEEISIASTGVLDAVEVLPGAIVKRVGLWNNGDAISGADLDVGVTGCADKFLDGVTTIAANDIVWSGLAGAVGADPVGGAYFASGAVIQLDVNTAVSDRTVKVLVEYTTVS